MAKNQSVSDWLFAIALNKIMNTNGSLPRPDKVKRANPAWKHTFLNEQLLVIYPAPVISLIHPAAFIISLIHPAAVYNKPYSPGRRVKSFGLYRFVNAGDSITH